MDQDAGAALAPTPTPSPTPMNVDASLTQAVAPPPAPATPQELSLDDHSSLETPELRRGLPAKHARMADALRDTANLWRRSGRTRRFIASGLPAVLTLIHGTYGQPRAARTTLLIEREYHWPTLKKGIRACVLCCKCRRRKRAWSKQPIMMPARFIQPCKTLQMDIQDLKSRRTRATVTC